jgi:hypothetical protein
LNVPAIYNKVIPDCIDIGIFPYVFQRWIFAAKPPRPPPILVSGIAICALLKQEWVLQDLTFKILQGILS